MMCRAAVIMRTEGRHAGTVELYGGALARFDYYVEAQPVYT